VKAYAVVFEAALNNFAAYVPGIPGYVSNGKTREEIELHIREAIAFPDQRAAADRRARARAIGVDGRSRTGGVSFHPPRAGVCYDAGSLRGWPIVGRIDLRVFP
jgi:hypothetical protein